MIRGSVVLEDRFKAESEGLVKSWQRYDGAVLRDYLVGGVEDPRTNVQSILTRHFLIERLFGRRFEALADAELRFAIVAAWLRRLVLSSNGRQQLGLVLDALLDGAGHAGEITIPNYVGETFGLLPREIMGLHVPNYINEVLMSLPPESVDVPLSESVMNTFAGLWKDALKDAHADGISVLEPACGSANDYRFIHRFGIARFLNYHGFDICAKNIANAQGMFPGVSFAVGNVLEIDRDAKSFDYCYVHDLFEHLSLEAMGRAFEEIMRVARKGVCCGFFNMRTGTEHFEVPVEDYHWNTLSMPRIRSLIEHYACRVETIAIDSYLRQHFQCPDTHNKQAWTIIATIRT